jgi:glycosyltransferase involved in cell wall biosynthesis
MSTGANSVLASRVSDRPRILLITTVPITAAKFVVPLAKELSRAGYDVEFACSKGEFWEELAQAGFIVTEIPFSRNPFAPCNIVAFWKLYKLMRRRGFDAIHTYTPVASFIARMAAKLAGVPVIIYSMLGSLDVPGIAWWKRCLSFIGEKIPAGFTTHVFVFNADDEEDLKRRNLVSPDRLSCLDGLGVDLARFDPSRISEAAKARLRGEFGIGSNDKVVGFIGRLVRDKGIVELITAFSAVVAEMPCVKLLVVGDVLSSERDRTTIDRVQTLVEERKLNSHVIFTGLRNDIPELLSIMDFLLLPSYREGFPTVVIEAAAMGKPVITTSARGCRHSIQDGQTGIIVPPRDAQSLAQAMLTLLRNDELTRGLGQNNRKRAEGVFDSSRIISKQVSVYHQLVPSRPRRTTKRSRL